MPVEEISNFVLIGEPLVFQIESTKVLGEFRVKVDTLIVELAQIEGGGEGVLQSLWLFTEQYALIRELKKVEWIVHAINCAKPNLKLRRVFEKKGFKVEYVYVIGEAYHYLNVIDRDFFKWNNRLDTTKDLSVWNFNWECPGKINCWIPIDTVIAKVINVED